MRRLASIACLVALAAGPARAESRWALQFFGTGSEQADRIRIPIDDDAPGPDASTPADVGAGGLTLEVWVRGTTSDNGATAAGSCVDENVFGFDWIEGNIVLDRDIWGGSSRDFGVSFVDGCVRFGTGTGDAGDAETTLHGSTLVLDGGWHHLAVVRDAASGRKRIYVDGALDVESPAGVSSADLSYPDGGVPGAVSPWGPYLVVAAEKHDAGASFPSFAGRVDELRVWNVARSGAEIAAAHDEIVPASAPGLVGSWRFEEGGGAVACDATGRSPAGDVRWKDGVTDPWRARAADPQNTAPLQPLPFADGFECGFSAWSAVTP